MRVEPELLTHNKFKRLKRIVGEGAMEYVIVIWAHCQSNQRGGFWPGADADYVEMLCDWDGQAGVLFKALVECGRPKAGFIEVTGDGLTVHDWNAMNASFVANWKNGTKGGRPKTKAETAEETQSRNGFPLGFDDGSTGGSKRLAEETQSEPTGNPLVNPLETQSENGLTNCTKLNKTRLNLTKLSVNGHPSAEPTGNPNETQSDYGLAQSLVAILNELTGAKFDPPLHELDGIVGCLLDTHRDFAGIEKMLRRQVRLWLGDAKARHWLKPGTLFGANFHDYYGQRDLAVDSKKTGPNKTRPRAEVLHELATAREQNAPAVDIEILERELAAA